MGRKSPKDVSYPETGRDSRLKLILLVVALVLVAGYAAFITNIGSLVRSQIDGFMAGGLPIIPIAGLVGGLLCAIIAFRFLRRRPKKSKAKPAAATQAVARIGGRPEFMKTLAGQIETHAKAGRQFAIHVVDIDRFRAVNDILGEEEGDAFLGAVTERLLVLVNQPERLARTGDDEFTIIQPEAGGARHAEIYARRIEETLKDACAQVPSHARPGASIGIGVYPDHGDDPAKLMHSASVALHAAKDAGGGRFVVFSREMEMGAEARQELEKAIGDGLQQDWFELHFQPQYDLLTRRLTGFEALVRMRHPERGVMAPEAFLPVAETSGLIQPLGEWIIREALTTASAWPAHLMLAINISPAQFRHGDVAATILDMLSKSGMDGTRLRVEISEAVLADDSDSAAEQLQRLKKSGVTIVLDDFGLESSKLKSISRFACDTVKLDRTLIERVGEPEVESLVKSLIGTAQSFDLGVQAEGIERAEQVHFLMSNDCRNVQGFLFGRPMQASELAAIIAKDMRKSVEGEKAPAEGKRSRSAA